MTTRTRWVSPCGAALIALAATACTVGDDPATAQTGNSPTSGIPARPGASDAGADGSGVLPSDAGDGGDAASALVNALTALTANCNVASNGKFTTGTSTVATVDVCRLNGAYFWRAGMDIDCDGQSTTECNANTAPGYSPQTSFAQSNGQPLVSATMSYYVLPLPSTRFDYRTAGIKPGAVGVVLYAGQMRYGVFADVGDATSIGAASYAMASHLGVNPNPRTGGVQGGVTYIAFTGTGAVSSPIENHTAAVALGEQLTTTLLQNN